MDLLAKVVALESEASLFGFQWETTEQIMEQIQSECAEVNEHLADAGIITKQSALQEEIGDLLHAVLSLTVFCKLCPRWTLKRALTKFERRLQAVKSIAKENGLKNLKGQPFDKLMLTWEQAKERKD